MKVTFVSATAADFDYFHALRKQTMQPHLARCGVARSEEDWLARHRTRFDPGTLRLIFLDGARAGFVDVRREEDGARNIGLFCLEPAFQGRGLGTRVMEMILSEENSALRLVMIRGNPAARLYERLGFVAVREKDHLIFYERPAA
jgi:ribosomal protein S18 acetylase RimI-like enzyme